MIKAEIKGIVYDVPTTWFDVPYKTAVKVIKEKEPDNALCLLIGIDLETLNSLQNKSVATLYNCVGFIEDITIMENTEVLEKYKSIDYGSLPYGDTEKIRQYISNNKESSFLDLAPEVIKMITGDDINEMPFAEIIGSVDFFLKQWIASTVNTMNLTKVAGMKKASGQELKGLTDSEVSVLTLN